MNVIQTRKCEPCQLNKILHFLSTRQPYPHFNRLPVVGLQQDSGINPKFQQDFWNPVKYELATYYEIQLLNKVFIL